MTKYRVRYTNSLILVMPLRSTTHLLSPIPARWAVLLCVSLGISALLFVAGFWGHPVSAGRDDATVAPLPRSASRVALFDARTSQPPTLVVAARALRSDQALDLLPLRDRLAALIAEHSGEASVAIVDLRTGESIHISGQRRHLAASVIKLYIGMAIWRDVVAGTLPLSAVDFRLREMLVLSNNVAAGLLLDQVGFAAVQREIDRIGAFRTVLTHPPGFETQQAPGFAANVNLTTALDSVRALSDLWRGGSFSVDAGHGYLERLESVVEGPGIPAQIPAFAARVLRKFGWVLAPAGALPSLDTEAVNDIGVVQFSRDGEAQAYAIAVFTQRNERQLLAWRLIANISGETWRFFSEERYPRPS